MHEHSKSSQAQNRDATDENMNYQTTFCTKINSWTSVLCFIENLFFPDLVMTSDMDQNLTRLWLRHASEPDADRKTTPGENCEHARKTKHNQKAHLRDISNPSRLHNFQPSWDFLPFPLSSSCTLGWVTACPSTRKCPSKRTHKVHFTGTFRECWLGECGGASESLRDETHKNLSSGFLGSRILIQQVRGRDSLKEVNKELRSNPTV